MVRKRKKSVRVTIAKVRWEENPRHIGYQVRINGRPQQIAMGEANWWNTKSKAKKWADEVRSNFRKTKRRKK